MTSVFENRSSFSSVLLLRFLEKALRLYVSYRILIKLIIVKAIHPEG
ncbi:MAG: hypothetical protein ACOC2H_03630 [Spirochaetota bacterium]